MFFLVTCLCVPVQDPAVHPPPQPAVAGQWNGPPPSPVSVTLLFEILINLHTLSKLDPKLLSEVDSNVLVLFFCFLC